MAEADEPKRAEPSGEENSPSPDEAPKESGGSSEELAHAGTDAPFPVVGLGGSAGSLRALQTFFGQMPADSGMAFVVVVHLSPDFDSSMAHVLQRSTNMPVEQVQESTELKTNCVYIIPPGKGLSVEKGQLRIADLTDEEGKGVAVDLFFRTLADNLGPLAVGIILSGANGDGVIGLKRVKELGGLTIAQDADEAEQAGMPRAAIATGMVDWVLPVSEMPHRLTQYRRNGGRLLLPSEQGPQLARPAASSVSGDNVEAEVALRETLNFLRARTGRDFSYYKRATILRRLARRMQVNALATLPEYLTFLRMQQAEVSALLQDLLISVTNFFRDKDAFQALEKQIPSLFKGKTSTDHVRAWVPGCATGEEAYSIAMLLCEYASSLEAPPALQVFATDLDESAIRTAREGVYGESITVDVAGERLRRFFSKDQGGYRVRKDVREIVLFAVHDLLKDSPFSRIDLVACRNLLIYITREAQAHAFDIFHFALRQEGLLFLGTSESADDASSLFAPIDKKYRIYARRSAYRPAQPLPSRPLYLTLGQNPRHSSLQVPPTVPSTDRVGAPPAGLAALLPERLSGARPFSWGEVHLKLIERLGPPSVLVDREHNIVHVSEHAGRFLQFGAGEPTMNLLRVVHPGLRIELRSLLLHAEKNKEPIEARRVPCDIEGARREINIRVCPTAELGPELLLVTFDEGETVASQTPPARPTQEGLMAQQFEQEVDHLKAQLRDTVEQYEASTEELKASNEELQAMNEELRSASEELETNREELQSINEELTTVNQELKSKVEELSNTNSDLQNLMGSTNIATVFLDRDLRIKRYTPSAVPLFNLIPTDVGRPLSHLRHRLNYDVIVSDAEKVLEHLGAIQREVDSTDAKWYIAGLLPYRTMEDRIDGVVLTFVDITDRKLAEGTLAHSQKELEGVLERAQRSHEQAEAATRKKDNFLMLLSHELRDSLAPVLQAVESLLQGKALTRRQRNGLETIRQNVATETQCLGDSLDLIRASQGSLELRYENFDLHDAVRAGIRSSGADLKRKHQNLNLDLGAQRSEVYADLVRLERVLGDLLRNASRFTPSEGEIHITTRNNPGHIIVEVSDNGDGIEPASLSDVFEPFRQTRRSTSGESHSSGLALAMAKAVVEAHGGTLTASSRGRGLGSMFTLRLSLADA